MVAFWGKWKSANKPVTPEALGYVPSSTKRQQRRQYSGIQCVFPGAILSSSRGEGEVETMEPQLQSKLQRNQRYSRFQNAPGLISLRLFPRQISQGDSNDDRAAHIYKTGSCRSRADERVLGKGSFTLIGKKEVGVDRRTSTYEEAWEMLLQRWRGI